MNLLSIKESKHAAESVKAFSRERRIVVNIYLLYLYIVGMHLFCRSCLFSSFTYFLFAFVGGRFCLLVRKHSMC